MATVAQVANVQLKSVLIATDFSSASDKPLRHALAIARCYEAKIYLAHVVSSLGFTMSGPDATYLAEQAVRRDAARLEDDLAAEGAFNGLHHEVIIRQGLVWEELEESIQQEQVDLTVIGTHGRHGIDKLLLGSVAEQIFRHATCPVLTVGPGAYREPRVQPSHGERAFLFATDFGDASLHALSHAVSFANHFGAKLVFFHVLPVFLMPESFNFYTASDVAQMREDARRHGLQQLNYLARNAHLDVEPAFVVQDAASGPGSESILEAASKLKADLIIMGLHRSAHVGTASHLPWTTAYEVVCAAGCPVLTVRSEGRHS